MACPFEVPEGSILGPIRFLLYVNDVAQYMKRQNCAIFADDDVMYSFDKDISDIESAIYIKLPHGMVINRYVFYWY